MVGYARTLATSPSAPTCGSGSAGQRTPRSTRDQSVCPGDVLVIEARGESGAGAVGDILAARVLARCSAAIVTDGGVATPT